jgi:sarcosine oxidase delta subunit
MADFRIISKPVAISFECPFCEEDVELSWAKLNPPECWCDEWEDVKCPFCGERVSLGDYTYD